jgi:hypothetical protein
MRPANFFAQGLPARNTGQNLIYIGAHSVQNSTKLLVLGPTSYQLTSTPAFAWRGQEPKDVVQALVQGQSGGTEAILAYAYNGCDFVT